MDKLPKIVVEVETKGLDEAIEKVKQFNKLLEKSIELQGQNISAAKCRDAFIMACEEIKNDIKADMKKELLKDVIFQDFHLVNVIVDLLRERELDYGQATEADRELIKEEFINRLIKEVSKEESRKVASHLSDVVFHKKTKTTEFSICTENVSIQFEFKHDF